jgi:hypothetical protein
MSISNNFSSTSRYYGLETVQLERANGATIVYLERRRASGSITSPLITWATRNSSGACATPTGPCDRMS